VPSANQILTGKKYLIKFRFIKGICPFDQLSQLRGKNLHFVTNKEGKFKILTSLGCRNDISGLCCKNFDKDLSKYKLKTKYMRHNTPSKNAVII